MACKPIQQADGTLANEEQAQPDDGEFTQEEGENSASDSEAVSSEAASDSDNDEDDVTPGSLVWAPFTPRQYFPAIVVNLSDVPPHLHHLFSKISVEQLIVKWIEEENFSAVRKTRVDPIGTSELDHQRASRSSEIMRRYKIALDLISAR